MPFGSIVCSNLPKYYAHTAMLDIRSWFATLRKRDLGSSVVSHPSYLMLHAQLFPIFLNDPVGIHCYHVKMELLLPPVITFLMLTLLVASPFHLYSFFSSLAHVVFLTELSTLPNAYYLDTASLLELV